MGQGSTKQKKAKKIKIYPMAGKNNKIPTKGVAMSFGFKRRPTPMTTSTNEAWKDANGNKDIKRNLPERRSQSETRSVTIVTSRVEDSVIQPGKFTFQTTRLPRPESVRVFETKTAKTIANNNKRSESLRRSEEIGLRLQNLSLYSPPPLPDLPTSFRIGGGEKQDSNTEKRLFSALMDSPQEPNWQLNGGEAMADEASLICNSLDMIDSLKESMHLTISETDQKFAGTGTGLLDDEVLSPVDSLVSSEEAEPETKPPLTLSFSDNKDDFLIDDEIADQPELVLQVLRESPKRLRIDFSPLRHGSNDSLSTCESIESEDLMMDYDLTVSCQSLNKQSSPFATRKLSNYRLRTSQECLTLTKANHSAIQQDIIGLKTMLLTLKRVLNEETISRIDDNFDRHNNNNGVRSELADLRRQILFLQGQLEDKETTVNNLQKQINNLPMENTFDNHNTNHCNAATQTDKVRPNGLFFLTTTPLDESQPFLR